MNSDLIKNFLQTLLYSWGGDTPAEAIWAANSFMEVLAECSGDQSFLNIKFIEMPLGAENQQAMTKVLALIQWNAPRKTIFDDLNSEEDE